LAGFHWASMNHRLTRIMPIRGVVRSPRSILVWLEHSNARSPKLLVSFAPQLQTNLVHTPMPLKGNRKYVELLHFFRPLSRESGDSLWKLSCGVDPAEKNDSRITTYISLRKCVSIEVVNKSNQWRWNAKHCIMTVNYRCLFQRGQLSLPAVKTNDDDESHGGQRWSPRKEP
jgi:hypothetical protein